MCRICEVGEKDELAFDLNAVIGQLEVTVRSPAGTKKHYYHMQHGLTRDIPWKAGPVSQYYPVPEPIPEADLALPVLATKVATNGEKPGEASTVEASGRPPRADASTSFRLKRPATSARLVAVVPAALSRGFQLTGDRSRRLPVAERRLTVGLDLPPTVSCVAPGRGMIGGRWSSAG
jgi:hypothetical protein